MMKVIDYLKARYLSEKAQGMVEYALILAFVVIIAAVLMNSSGLSGGINNVFDSATSQLNAQ